MSIIGIIGTILGGIDFIALLSLFLYYKLNKLAKDIENDAHGNEALQSVIATLREQLERSDADSRLKLEKLDEAVETINQLKVLIATLEFENTKNCFWKCELKGCANRVPPNGL